MSIMKPHHNFSLYILTVYLLLGFVVGAKISEKNYPHIEEASKETWSDLKVSNEFLQVEEKPSPVVSTRNLILMMVKASMVDSDVAHQEEDVDEETLTFHISPQGALETSTEGHQPNAEWRFDRFYYCGPKKENSCKSLCYARGYPRITCGRISCYCTF